MNCRRCGNELLVGEQNCKRCGESIYTQNNNFQPVNNGIAYNQCKLTLIRKKSMVGFLATFDIYIDRVKVGKVKNGQILELNVTMGQHKISINKKNEMDIIVNGDTTAEVGVIGPTDAGIVNINGQSLQTIDNKTNINYVEKSKNATNTVLIASIIFPIISIIMYYTIKYIVAVWIYGAVIGYAIINIAVLKKQKNSIDNNMSKELMIKNVIAIIITICAIIITMYISDF